MLVIVYRNYKNSIAVINLRKNGQKPMFNLLKFNNYVLIGISL